jgi:tRNA(His) 5'-end guanylyltransferase
MENSKLHMDSNGHVKDALGNRMKKYEDVTRYHLLPRSYVLCRIDGCHFHSYLKGCTRPFDVGVIEDMDATAVYLCENVQNVKLGYVQSDEITLLLCDFDSYTTSQFFDGNIQKISSVVASMAAARFNQLRMRRFGRWCDAQMETKIVENIIDTFDLATFDCRCWVVPTRWEAANVFLWRNQDCSRNSVSMVAQSLYSHNQLMGKSSVEQQEMIHDKGVSWVNDFSAGEKNGRLIVKETYEIVAEYETCERTRWVSKGAWKFTEDKEKLLAMIPTYPA